MAKILPINNGYYNCKSIDGILFESRVSEYSTDGVPVGADLIQYKGKEYVVGHGEFNLGVDKTQSDFTKLLIFNTVAQFVDADSEEVESFDIKMTAPPLYFNGQKTAFPDYLKGHHEIMHNRRKKVFKINSVETFPESILAYFANSKVRDYKNKYVLVIDIGGLTTNGLVVKNGAKEGQPFTIQNGMHHLNNEIAQYLNGKYYLNCTAEQIETYRQEGLYVNGAERNYFELEQENIETMIYDKFLRKIVQECAMKQYNYTTYEVLITGGGGKTLFKTIKEKFLPQAHLGVDPINDNLNGLRIVTRS